MNAKFVTGNSEKKAKVMFICRGSVHDGIGHVIRSRSLAGAMNKGLVKMVVIGDPYIENLLVDRGIDFSIVTNEDNALEEFEKYKPDICIFDLMHFNTTNFLTIKQSTLTISLSPIFNCLKEVELIFHRTAVHGADWPVSRVGPLIKSGLQYTIVGEHCNKIPEDVFKNSLSLKTLSIAVSMGGTDAANKTLQVLNTIKQIPEKLLIWVLLGEGYAHSYQDLVDSISGDKHEIILAKTNDAMWRILSTCSLAILAGGTTTYEAVFAGLPSINTFETEQHLFLIQELLEKQVCLCAGHNFEESLLSLNDNIRLLNADRSRLLKMHLKSKQLVDGKGAARIAEEIYSHYYHKSAAPNLLR